MTENISSVGGEIEHSVPPVPGSERAPTREEVEIARELVLADRSGGVAFFGPDETVPPNVVTLREPISHWR